MDISHYDEQQQFHQFVFGKITGYGETPGTYRLKLPFLSDQQNVIEDAQLLRPYFGKDYGVLLEPEVNDLVLLFLHGKHVRKAIIMGVLPPEDSTFLKQHTDENSEKILCSREQIKFSLHDEHEKQKLIIETPKSRMFIDDENMNMGMQDSEEKNYFKLNQTDGELQLHADKNISLTCGDSSCNLQEDGSILINGKTMKIDVETISIEAKNKVNIAAQEIGMEAKVNMEISGKSSFKVVSNAVFEITANLIKIGS